MGHYVHIVVQRVPHSHSLVRVALDWLWSLGVLLGVILNLCALLPLRVPDLDYHLGLLVQHVVELLENLVKIVQILAALECVQYVVLDQILNLNFYYLKH